MLVAIAEKLRLLRERMPIVRGRRWEQGFLTIDERGVGTLEVYLTLPRFEPNNAEQFTKLIMADIPMKATWLFKADAELDAAIQGSVEPLFVFDDEDAQ